MQQRTRMRNAVTAAVMALSAIAASAAVADTFVVTPTQSFGWTFAQDNATPGGTAFVDGPGTPPMGSGSAQLTANLTTDGPVLFKADYNGTKLSDITALKYSTYRTAPTDTSSVLAIALQFNVDSDITDTNEAYQGRLVFEPYQGAPAGTVVPGVWQTWNALQGVWWGSPGGVSGSRPISDFCPQSNPCTWQQIIAQFPNAGIHNTQGAVVFKAGSSWTGFDGNVDAFTIGVSGANETYDFNLHSTPTDKDQCKNGGFKNFNPPSGPYKNQGQCVSASNHS